jgi:outer membrane protein
LNVSDAVNRDNLEALFGRPFPGLPHHIGPFQVFTAGPQFSMALLDLSLWSRLQAARETTSASRADQQSVREQITLLTVSQYLGAMRAAAEVRAAQSRVDLAQALYDLASDQQKNGVGTGLDTLRANVELQNEKQVLLDAQTQHDVAIFGLARILNVDPQQPIVLSDEMSFYQTPDFSSESTVQSAYLARPEMQQLEANYRSAMDSRRATSESRLPTISGNGAWTYQGLSITTGIPAYQYTLSASVPIFTGGRIHSEIAVADLEVQKLQQRRDDLRAEIALEVKSALAQLESARHQVDVANLGVQLAQQAIDQSRDRFRAGVANNIEVIQAQDALSRANDNQIAALYQYNESRANLSHAIGQMESLYAK